MVSLIDSPTSPQPHQIVFLFKELHDFGTNRLTRSVVIFTISKPLHITNLFSRYHTYPPIIIYANSDSFILWPLVNIRWSLIISSIYRASQHVQYYIPMYGKGPRARVRWPNCHTVALRSDTRVLYIGI